MNVLWKGVQWLFDSQHWWGADGLLNRTVEHLGYSAAALLIAVAIALPIGLLIGHTGRGTLLAAGTANLWRSVPTYGLVSLLFVWKPLTLWPLVLALAVLAIPPVMLNTAAGMANVDRQTRDAADGVGLTGWQVMMRVEAPCALPLILAGVRSAANQVIATAAILGFKGQGGLGRFIFTGYANQQYYVVYGASIAIVALVLVVEGGFAVLQRAVVSPGLRLGRSGKRVSRPKLSSVVGNLNATGRST